ncbi:hypothetical protein PIB30_069064 [Stylosanthes scabra]|uniref:Uncharacterized protein n=1 Tax=Stylosanthes scabra TaxID=79078 RepID=A0ABU6TPM3_9FABA|nr:hypothetical protein [Stylosanthes scabra]
MTRPANRGEQSRSRSPSSGISHGSNSGGGFDNMNRLAQHSRVKLNLPKFDGSDALCWIFAIDQYFEFFRVPEDE